MKLKILYEDNQIIAINKPAGILIQGDSTGRDTLFAAVKKYIKEKYNKTGNVFLGLVHRLDMQVSGAVIFAKTSKAASRLFNEFYGKRVVKIYCVIVHNRPNIKADGLNKSGEWTRIEHDLKQENGNPVIVHEKNEKSKHAALEYAFIKSEGNYSLLIIKLITGRKRQIRLQLSHIGYPVTGDIKFGSDEKLESGAICLHSYYLRFSHPTKKIPVELFADIPGHFKAFMVIPENLDITIKRLLL